MKQLFKTNNYNYIRAIVQDVKDMEDYKLNPKLDTQNEVYHSPILVCALKELKGNINLN